MAEEQRGIDRQQSAAGDWLELRVGLGYGGGMRGRLVVLG